MAGNAVDRFWRARQLCDWESLIAQLQRGVSIVMIHEDTELSRAEFSTFLRAMHHNATTTIHRNIAGRGHQIAVLATIAGARSTFECAGFYDLREGRIEVVREMWLPRGGASMMDFV